MDDMAQRGDVVLLAHVLRQLHQADEHGRHHEDGVDLVALDQPEKFFGLEARHQHQRAPELAGADAERVRRGVIERARQDHASTWLQPVDHRAHALAGCRLFRRRRIAPHALGMACRPRSVDHVHGLRHDRAVIGLVLREPGFEIDREVRRLQMIGIDLVVGQDLGGRRHAEHGDAAGDRIAQTVQHVGMADQHGRAGVLQDVVDLLRLEVPVDRHAIGAEPHRRIGCLEESDVVAHQHADTIALPDAELAEAIRDAVGAAGDVGMGAAALAGDNAQKLGGFAHLFFFVVRCQLVVITGLVPVIHVLASSP